MWLCCIGCANCVEDTKGALLLLQPKLETAWQLQAGLPIDGVDDVMGAVRGICFGSWGCAGSVLAVRYKCKCKWSIRLVEAGIGQAWTRQNPFLTSAWLAAQSSMQAHPLARLLQSTMG